MAWYNTSWLYRVKVVVLAFKVNIDLTDYHACVDIRHTENAITIRLSKEKFRNKKFTKCVDRVLLNHIMVKV